jgi:hypothetical protein
MPKLTAVLLSSDLPLAELCAARLDGELYAIDSGYSPIDLPEDAEQRARSIIELCPDRIIAEQRTAAWIWGATDSPPTRHELCASLGARSKSAVPRRATVREVVIDEVSIVELGGIRVTTPLRTILDLVRFNDDFDDETQRQVGWLMTTFGVALDDCVSALDARRNLPGKRRALVRLAAVASRC